MFFNTYSMPVAQENGTVMFEITCIMYEKGLCRQEECIKILKT